MVSNVVPLNTAAGPTLGECVAAFLARDGRLAASTRRVYAQCLERLVADLGAQLPVGAITTDTLDRHLEATYPAVRGMPATYNRCVATIGSLFTWAAGRGLVAASPAVGLERRRERRTRPQEAHQRAVSAQEVTAWAADRAIPLRERLLWQMLYDTAARASEVLSLNVEDLDKPNRCGTVIGKGGDAERVYWTSATARLLPRYLQGRTRGPLFLSGRRLPPARAAANVDLDPASGRPRLSYRRAAQLFTDHTGRNLHTLRHSRLTHLAEAGENIAILRGISRHASLRSLERYVHPSDQAIQAAMQRHDPNRRRVSQS